jgi:hypothetical protein
VDLAPGGHALVAEILAPGRLHAGETFAYRRLALNFSAHCSGSPLLADNLILEPAAWPFSHTALFGLPYAPGDTLRHRPSGRRDAGRRAPYRPPASRRPRRCIDRLPRRRGGAHPGPQHPCPDPDRVCAR